MTPGRRVLVVGGPGSGKTTYAGALAADLLARDGANSSRTLEVFLHPVRDKVERTGPGPGRRRPR